MGLLSKVEQLDGLGYVGIDKVYIKLGRQRLGWEGGRYISWVAGGWVGEVSRNRGWRAFLVWFFQEHYEL